MSEKPGKRLVSKGQYLRLLGKRTAMNSSASGIGCVGSVLLLMSGLALLQFAVFHRALNESIVEFFFTLAACTTAGIFAIHIARNLFREAKAIERVAPLTRHNTGLLPEIETLVRPSYLPPSDQQAELLRGVGSPVCETPQEELLRATTKGMGE